MREAWKRWRDAHPEKREEYLAKGRARSKAKRDAAKHGFVDGKSAEGKA
jgi:hypothetical protein